MIRSTLDHEPFSGPFEARSAASRTGYQSRSRLFGGASAHGPVPACLRWASSKTSESRRVCTQAYTILCSGREVHRLGQRLVIMQQRIRIEAGEDLPVLPTACLERYRVKVRHGL